jgi:hypothetical protein
MSGAWGTTEGQVAFKLRPNRTWDGTEFGSDNILTIDDSYFYCWQNGSGNINVYGLEDGVSYTITFKTEGNSVQVKIAQKESE